MFEKESKLRARLCSCVLFHLGRPPPSQVTFSKVTTIKGLSKNSINMYPRIVTELSLMLDFVEGASVSHWASQKAFRETAAARP